MKTAKHTAPHSATAPSRVKLLSADVFRRGVALCVGSLDDMWALTSPKRR